MAYYLQMDGVDDKLQLPSMSATKFIIDCSIDSTQDHTRDVVLDTRSGSTYFMDIGFMNMRFKVDGGTEKTSNVDIPKDNTRHTLEIYANIGATTVMTDDFTVFAKSDGTTPLKGKIYSVSVYNLTTLVASYDMTLGNVQDQSGNGRHATLTGGTWVDDGGGGTSITVNSVTANSTSAVNAPVVATQKNVSVSSVITDSAIQALPPVITNASNAAVTSVTATSSLSTGIPGVSASASLNITSTIANSVVSAIPPFIGSMEVTVNSVAASASSQFVPPNVTIAHEIISVVNLEFETLKTVQLEASINRVVNVEALLTRIVALEGEL